MLHPVNTQTQGVQAWLLAKEDYAQLSADLRKRSDFQEHSTPHLMVNNGQSAQVPAVRARNYVRDVLLKSDGWGNFEPQMAQYDEGFKLEFSPLLSLDSKVVDAVIRCEVDQIEKMIPVMIDVSTPSVRGQRLQDRSAAGHLHAAARAFSLAGRPGAAGEPGHRTGTGGRHAQHAQLAGILTAAGGNAGVRRKQGKGGQPAVGPGTGERNAANYGERY